MRRVTVDARFLVSLMFTGRLCACALDVTVVLVDRKVDTSSECVWSCVLFCWLVW